MFSHAVQRIIPFSTQAFRRRWRKFSTNNSIFLTHSPPEKFFLQSQSLKMLNATAKEQLTTVFVCEIFRQWLRNAWVENGLNVDIGRRFTMSRQYNTLLEPPRRAFQA